MKEMDIIEFKDLGYLQEVNRQFFHPLGLALAVEDNEAGKWKLSCVFDEREDPEGFLFTEGQMREEDFIVKKECIEKEMRKKHAYRIKSFGFDIQE